MNPVKFRTALKAARITQKDFAASCGVHCVTVNRWLKGDLPLPKWAPLALVGLEAVKHGEGSP